MRGPARVLLLVVAAIVVVALLFAVVFPWFDRTYLTDPVLDARLLHGLQTGA
jgi:hypothetical protein